VKDYRPSDVRFVRPAARWYGARRDDIQSLEAGIAWAERRLREFHAPRLASTR